MSDADKNFSKRQTIRRCRFNVGLLLFGSLAAFLGGAFAVSKQSTAEFLAGLSSPMAIVGFGLFYLIYLPASLRVYYISLLNAKGVFTASERQYYQEGKQKWQKYLFRSALLAGILVVLLAVMLILTR